MNNYSKNVSLVQNAINLKCSSLQPNPYLVQRILADAQKAPKSTTAQKKFSVAILFLLVLLLVSVGAVAAAFLSMRQVVEETAVPMAVQTEGENFTAQETRLLMKIAEENNIVLSQNAKDNITYALEQGQGYFKEEILMEFAKAEFGPNPGQWTMEQQKWFDDMCVAICFIDAPEKGLPENAEETKQTMILVARKAIQNEYPAQDGLDNPEQYDVHVQYLLGSDNSEFHETHWCLLFAPKVLEGSEYWVYLNEEGNILKIASRPGLSALSTVNEIDDAYWRAYGNMNTWSQSMMRAFQSSVLQSPDTNHPAYLCLKRTSYPDIPQNAISKEKAYEIAADHLSIDHYMITGVYLIGTNENPVWKLNLNKEEEIWSFEIDCLTGEIKTVRLKGVQDHKWWMNIVLWDVSDQVMKTWTDIEPSIG